MDKALPVEIIAYAPTAFYHCTHCEVAWSEMGATNQIHDEQVRNSLPEDLIQEYQEISDWVRELFRQHCDRIIIKVIDAASIEGVFKVPAIRSAQISSRNCRRPEAFCGRRSAGSWR